MDLDLKNSVIVVIIYMLIEYCSYIYRCIYIQIHGFVG